MEHVIVECDALALLGDIALCWCACRVAGSAVGVQADCQLGEYDTRSLVFANTGMSDPCLAGSQPP